MTRPPPSEHQRTSDRLARKDERQDKRRQEILAVARDLLLAGEPLQISAVATRAGLSKPSLYYYFRSNEDIFVALLEQVFSELTTQLTEVISQSPTGIAALEAMIRSQVELFTHDPNTFRLRRLLASHLATNLDASHSGSLQTIYAASKHINDLLEQKLQQDLTDGILTPSLPPRLLANIAWTSTHGLLDIASALSSANGDLRFGLPLLCDTLCACFTRAAHPDAPPLPSPSIPSRTATKNKKNKT